jgi:predicted CoA-binding protein
MISSKITLVVGASENPSRYSNMAMKMLNSNKQNVIAFGLKSGVAHGIEIENKWPIHQEVDTVTLYIGPQNQPQYYKSILDLKPRRVIFNPGTENDEFADLLQKNGIEVVENCTLVMLSIGIY